MKKIGILTFSYSSNPGSVLQAYALQKNISQLGDYDPTIINYQKTRAGKPVIGKTVFYKPVRKWTLKKIIEWTLKIISYPVRMAKYERFFKRHYNHYPMQRYTRDNVTTIGDEYDAFVVGSDQVWNMKSINVDYTYFLDFIKEGHKKISYAASFGGQNVPEKIRSDVQTFIKDFESISVREQIGVDIVSELTGRQAEWVLDPSLLLDKEDYLKLAQSHRKRPCKQKYVLLYMRENSPELTAFAEKIAMQSNLKLIRIVRHWLCVAHKNIPVVAVGPEEWINYMNNAECIVTNSFHGVCFSLTLEKEFYVGLLKQGLSHTNPRIESVIKQFNVENRQVDYSIINRDSYESIDYAKVNETKKRKRKTSLEYLKNALERSVELDA